MSEKNREGESSGGDVESGPGATEVSKEDADRLKPGATDADGDAIPGEDPEDNPDEDGEDRFDAG